MKFESLSTRELALLSTATIAEYFVHSSYLNISWDAVNLTTDKEHLTMISFDVMKFENQGVHMQIHVLLV